MSNFQQHHLSIQQISVQTGLSKPVIRKWEDRYGTVTPKRLENGRRIYCDQDVQTLLSVKKLVDEGMGIREATQFVHETMNAKPKKIHIQKTFNEHYCNRLLEVGSACNISEIQRTLQEAHHTLGLIPFLDEVVIPLLYEIGVRWRKDEWNPYQESVCSGIVRDYLVALRHDYKVDPNAPFILAACLPGEIHDIPLCILLLKALVNGYRVYLMTISPAPGAIEHLISQFNPNIVLLSAMTMAPFELYPEEIVRLDAFAGQHTNVKFIIGGYGAKQYVNEHPLTNIVYLESIDHLLTGGNL